MKSLKRIASLLIVAAFVFQIAVVAAPVPQDVVGTEFETAANLLTALDIMVGDGENFNPDNNITRAEFAQILMKTMRLEDAVESYRPVGTFSDVPADNIFAPAVELGAQVGAIAGYGDGTFGPDDPVTGEQAVKLMVYAAGYNVTADMMGYPAGYLSTASEIGLLRNVTGNGFDMTAPITRGKAAILCFNTLKVDVLKKVSYGNSEVTYTTTPGETLLSLKHNVYQYDGLVTENSVSTLDNVGALAEDSVRITGDLDADESVFLIGTTDIADVLGQYVRVFYRVDEDSNDKTIVSYEVMSSKNDIITVEMSNLVAGGYNDVVNNYREVEYWESEDSNRTDTLRIEERASVIYNGTHTSNFDFDATLEKDGNIMFVDNDSDGIFEVLYVTAYENYVVSMIDTEEYMVYDNEIGQTTYNSETGVASRVQKLLDLDLEDDNIKVSITDKEGNEVAFDSLKEWNVLSVAQSDTTQSRQVVKMIVSTDKVTGEIMELDVNSNPPTVTVGEEVYEMAPNYVNYVTEDGSNPNTTLNLGDNTTFYLDAFGKIAGSEISAAGGDMDFGLMVRVGTNGGVDESVMAKIYSAKEKDLVTYTLAERVTIDGKSYKDPNEALVALQTGMTNANLYGSDGQACNVLFAANDEGYITTVDTAYTSADESKYSLRPKTGSLTFQKFTSKGGFLGNNPVASTATFIEIPTTYTDAQDAGNYKVQFAADLPNSNNDDNQLNSLLYVTEEGAMEVSYGVFKSASSGSSTYEASHDIQMVIVEQVTKCISSYSGDETIKVYGMQEGADVELTFSSKLYESSSFVDMLYTQMLPTGSTGNELLPEYRAATGLLPGDVIKVNLDSHQEVSAFRTIFLYQEKFYRRNSEGGDALSTPGKIWYLATEAAIPVRIDGDYVEFLNYARGGTGDSAPKYIGGDYAGEFGEPLPDDDYHVIKKLSSFKIMVFDPSREVGDQVYSGTMADVKAAESSTTPTAVIYQLRANTPRGLIVFKNN